MTIQETSRWISTSIQMENIPTLDTIRHGTRRQRQGYRTAQALAANAPRVHNPQYWALGLGKGGVALDIAATAGLIILSRRVTT